MSAAPPTVEEWEIASMHRTHATHPGTCVAGRVVRVPPNQVDRALGFYKDVLLPQFEGLDGFISASLLIDRAKGRAVTSVAYDSREAMEATRDHADYLRAKAPRRRAWSSSTSASSTWSLCTCTCRRLV